MIDASARAFEKGRRMSPETARTALTQYFGLLREQGVKTAKIGFSGGEPLLNWSMVRFCMHEAERLAERCGITNLIFGLNTNASLVTRGIARELSRYFIETVTVGLDGPERVNDSVRVLRNGKGTFSHIMAGLALLRDHLETPIGVISVLTHETLPFMQAAFLDFLKQEGASYLVVEPDLVRFPEVETDTLCDLLISMQRYGEEIGMEVWGMWLRPSLNFTSGDIPGGRMPMYHCNCQGGGNITITSTGLVVICPWTSPTFGHVSRLREILASKAYGEFIRRRFNTNIQACRGCSLEGTCDGGCYVSWDVGDSLGMRCGFYRKITRKLIQERIGAA